MAFLIPLYDLDKYAVEHSLLVCHRGYSDYALKINRDRFIIYSPQYGSTLEDLIGNNYVDAYKYELEKRVTDCLLVSPYIRSVDKVEVEFDSETGELTGDIYITTIYSEGVEVNV